MTPDDLERALARTAPDRYPEAAAVAGRRAAAPEQAEPPTSHTPSSRPHSATCWWR
jgi:hypothetical protein